MTGFDITIVTATSTSLGSGGPEFCIVQGFMQPELKFEVALPASWHRRFLMIGNGGYAGENLEQPSRASIRDAAIRAGFLFAQTNTGHDAAGQPLGSFATDRQKLYDYAFRAVHVTAEAAKRIATVYYGVAPQRSYFMGCSTGGRQALISAQRFPADFDGIYAGAPVLNFVDTMVSYAHTLQAFAKNPVSEAKLKTVGTIVYAQCDEKDGVKDGLIEDPRACGFKASTHLPRCTSTAASNDCFTEGEIASLERLYSDHSHAGRRVFPGWPVGVEAAAPDGHIGWYRWLVQPEGKPISSQFSDAFFRYLAAPEKDETLEASQLDLDRRFPNLDPIRSVLNATDTDLSGFRDRGGKLLMWFGWADPALNPMMGVEYYESVMRSMGPATPDFFRLFMMPGVFHCGGGIGCDNAQRLGALIDWVESGKAPASIPASRVAGGKVTRTRPLCPYPQVAKYKGSGSIDEASSFACAAP